MSHADNVIRHIESSPELAPAQQAEAEWLANVYVEIGAPGRLRADAETLLACRRAHPESTWAVGSADWHRGRFDAIAYGWPGRSGIGPEAALIFVLREAASLFREDAEGIRALALLATQWFDQRQTRTDIPN